MTVSEKKDKGILESLTTVVSGMFQNYTEPKPNLQPHKEKKAQDGFYYDKNQGTWVINGKKADAEHDMGQEPIGQEKSLGGVEPPPVAMMNLPKVSNVGVEPGTLSEPFSGAFGKVTIGHNKKKTAHKSVYVSQS